jgi:hypothetical protein
MFYLLDFLQLDVPDCALTTRACDRMSDPQMLIWQEHYIPPPALGFDIHMQARPVIIKSQRNCNNVILYVIDRESEKNMQNKQSVIVEFNIRKKTHSD